jgi:hypothetical protein
MSFLGPVPMSVMYEVPLVFWSLTTVSRRGAATVEVAVGTGSGAGYTALSVTADIDLGDSGGEGGGGRSALLGSAGLESRWGGGFAG